MKIGKPQYADGMLLETAATSGHREPSACQTPQEKMTDGHATTTKKPNEYRNSSCRGNNTHIRRLQIGHFIFSDLRAIIIPGANDVVLLGMNALGELKMTQQDGKIILQKPVT